MRICGVNDGEQRYIPKFKSNDQKINTYACHMGYRYKELNDCKAESLKSKDKMNNSLTREQQNNTKKKKKYFNNQKLRSCTSVSDVLLGAELVKPQLDELIPAHRNSA